MGAPEFKVDWKKVDAYLKAQCLGTDIADILGIHPNTLYRKCEEEFNINWSEYSRIKKTEGKALLRARMFDRAMSGDTTMSIFLAKNYLGLSDRQSIEISRESVDQVIWEE
jgi:hypothetical protein